MIIIVKVNKKPLAGSVLIPVSSNVVSMALPREWSKHSFLPPLPKQRWGEMSHCTATWGTAWACVSPQALFAAATLNALRSRVPVPDMWFIRLKTSHKMPVCPCVSVMSITMVLRHAWCCCHFLKENHKVGRKQPPGFWGLSWRDAARRLRRVRGKKSVCLFGNTPIPGVQQSYKFRELLGLSSPL